MNKVKQFAKAIHISIGIIGIAFSIYLITANEKGLSALAIIFSCSIIFDDVKNWNK